MKYAIIQSGGKQLRAQEGQIVEVERLDAAIGDTVEFGEVLLLADGDTVTIGAPLVKGVTLKGTVVGQVKGPKVIVFKYKPKQRYRVKTGHRQHYTQVQVETILGEMK